MEPRAFTAFSRSLPGIHFENVTRCTTLRQCKRPIGQHLLHAFRDCAIAYLPRLATLPYLAVPDSHLCATP